MKFKIILIAVFLFSFSCAKDEKKVSLIKEIDQEKEMASTYREAYEALDKGDPYFAATKFLEAEILYPQSQWAAKSGLMAAYSFYLTNYYTEALSNLERFVLIYPKSCMVFTHS